MTARNHACPEFEAPVNDIVERANRRMLAVKVKLSRSVSDNDVRQLIWLKERIGDDLLDGIGVIPAALLGA